VILYGGGEIFEKQRLEDYILDQIMDLWF